MIIILNFVLISNYKLMTKVLFAIISIGIIYFTGSRTAIIISIITIIITCLTNLKINRSRKEIIKSIIAIITILLVCLLVIQKNSKLFYSVRINELKDDMDDFSGRRKI